MKAKKWLISLGLAVVLVMAFALPACNGEPKEYWYTPEGERISFNIYTIEGSTADMALMITENLQDFGLDVSEQVLDFTTFLGYYYVPQNGEMEAYVYANDPSPDPIGDWIWTQMGDPNPGGYGYARNFCWYIDERYDELLTLNYIAANLSEKQAVYYEMQEILNEDLPLIYLARPDLIAAYRTDNWDNWLNEIGGPVSWLNEWSIREVTPVGDATRLNIGSLWTNDSVNMDTNVLLSTNIGCLYYMINYENLGYYAKLDEESLEANPLNLYEFVPKLATGYEVTYEDDGAGGTNQVWTFQLREGVKWHDYDTEGINFTSEDVVYSYTELMKFTATDEPINWTAVEENEGEILYPDHILVEADGDYAVKLTYIEGYHLTEGFTPGWILWYPIVPKHVFGPEGEGNYDGWNADPAMWDGESIGTGPYHLTEFEPGEYWLFERFDDYWGDLPAAEEVLHQQYSAIGSLFLALENGDIDCTDGESIPFVKIDAYEDDPNIAVDPGNGMRIFDLGFNLHPTAGYEPLQDKVLRQAIAYAIDRQDILDIVFGGYGEIPDAWCYSESGMHNPDLNQYEYNPTTARDMLLAANYTFHAEE
jgi:ABC-type transport system substrate-binding protein